MTKQEYFSNSPTSYWNWEDNHEVITIGRTTVVYKENLKQIISAIAVNGLPPLGSILLVLAATKCKETGRFEHLCDIIDQSNVKNQQLGIDQAILFLKKISELDEQYFIAEKKLTLLSAIFEKSHNSIKAKTSAIISKDFTTNGITDTPHFELNAKQAHRFYRDIRVLELLNRQFPSVNSIKTKLANLESNLVEELEIELNHESSDKPTLLDTLKTNSTTAKSGLLIERIWSSANIPMQLSKPSGRPFGGLADLTNKGTFDKLITSEFANDGVLFLSRIANNEAMFYHRESPPTETKKDRVVLLDVSLKNWGTTKTIANALMLAIYHHPNSNYKCYCHAVGKSVHELKIDTIDDIIDSIQILDTSLNANEGLKTFLEGSISANNEIFYITTKAATESDELNVLLQEFNYPINYWLYTSPAGSVDIYKKHRKGKKLHQSFLLPLKELWGKKKRSTTVTQKVDIYITADTPLLLPAPANYKFNLAFEANVYRITGDGYIMVNYDTETDRINYNQGWQLLYSGLSIIHAEHVLGRSIRNGTLYLLSFNKFKETITITNITAAKQTVIKTPLMEDIKQASLFFYEHRFHLISPSKTYELTVERKWEILPADRNIYLKRKCDIRANYLKSISNRFHYSESIFKNFNLVAIDHKGQLILNKTRLILNANGNIILKNFEVSEYKLINARKEEPGVFVFSDGSKLVVKLGGIISLISSNSSIPTIQIISKIEEPLAAVVESTFAGNKKYYKPTKWLCKINHPKNGIEYEEILNRSLLTKEKQIIDQYNGLEKKEMKYIFEAYIQKYIKHIQEHAINY